MNDLRPVLNAVLPVFAITVAGFLLRRWGALTEEADRSMLRLTVNVLFPCLLLDSVLGNPALAHWNNLLLAPMVGAGTFLLGLGLAWLAKGWTGLKTEPETRTFILTVGLYNYGFVPIPLALLLFGQETVGVLFVHNLGVELMVWTAGVMVLTGIGISRGLRQMINGPLISMVLALALNFSGAAPHLPEAVRTTLHLLAQCAIPLSLLLAGAMIEDHLEEFHSAPGWRVIAAGLALRIVLAPALFLIVAKWLPATVELKRVIVLQAAMPSALFPIILAKHYGGDPPTALRVVLATSAVALITIPFWIRFGLAWVGVE